MEDANMLAKAIAIVNGSDIVYAASINEEGYPAVAARSNVRPEGLLGCYLNTGTSGALSRAVQRNGKMGVCFHQGADNVSLTGKAAIVIERDLKAALWKDGYETYFPKGIEDPEYCVIRFRTQRLSLWIESEQNYITLDNIREPQSCCGLICATCSFRIPHNCGGCLATGGHPFYGACPIAACCREKNLTHCGDCPDMPCAQLNEYSCGESEHADNPKGARLKVLRFWKAANESVTGY